VSGRKKKKKSYHNWLKIRALSIVARYNTDGTDRTPQTPSRDVFGYRGLFEPELRPCTDYAENQSDRFVRGLYRAGPRDADPFSGFEQHACNSRIEREVHNAEREKKKKIHTYTYIKIRCNTIGTVKSGRLTAFSDPVIYGLWERFDVAFQLDFGAFRGADQLAGRRYHRMNCKMQNARYYWRVHRTFVFER